jgi:hypothetical protein
MEVNPSFPAKTVPEFIAYAKANPHNIMMASAAVRGRAHDRLGGDIAAGALAVVNNERLAEPFRQPLADQPCNDVDVVASGESDDDAHRPRRIGLPLSQSETCGRQRGRARGQMQDLSTVGKFHFEPPSRFTSFDDLVGELLQVPPIGPSGTIADRALSEGGNAEAAAVSGPSPLPCCAECRRAAIAASRVALGTRSTPRLGILRCIRQALATEAVAECICCCGVGKAESNIDLLDLASTPAAADRDASFTVKCINL